LTRTFGRRSRKPSSTPTWASRRRFSIVEKLEAEANAGEIKDSASLIKRLREVTAEHFCQDDGASSDAIPLPSS